MVAGLPRKNSTSQSCVSDFSPLKISCDVVGYTCHLFFILRGWLSARTAEREISFLPRKILLSLASVFLLGKRIKDKKIVRRLFEFNKNIKK